MTSALQYSVFAHSPAGLPVFQYSFGTQGRRVLILGAVHGDEVEGVAAAFGLLENFQKNFPYRLQITLIPIFNPDGVLAKTRTNSHGVDLNRNLSTQDWSAHIATPRYHPGPHPLSEPENQALAKLLDSSLKPDFICSLHSYKPMINVNGDCADFAKVLAQHTGYEIVPDMGYPTPGSLGTFAAVERGIPTVTFEIERGQPASETLRQHVPALLSALYTLEV